MSDDHETTEDQAAGGDTASYEGYVYVATNPAMPNMVKIGSTTHTIPKPYHCAVHDQCAPAVRAGVRASNRG